MCGSSRTEAWASSSGEAGIPARKPPPASVLAGARPACAAGNPGNDRSATTEGEPTEETGTTITFLADADVMDVFNPGSHGSTFGGNALAAAVALEALQVIEDEDLIEIVKACQQMPSGMVVVQP